jgi:hypothetical protein
MGNAQIAEGRLAAEDQGKDVIDVHVIERDDAGANAAHMAVTLNDGDTQRLRYRWSTSFDRWQTEPWTAGALPLQPCPRLHLA